ncbi:hypothetical protein FNV43_RR23416 [Rhamnella rubrinervis]|uniref:Bifunctional inhibitor/plant lipid transfer protein/seed storage helical domain-containing protein n=1 Tax=Rhamnella rubrinervis TaxID=2594499 RepID=A0A8K0DYG8_9ROSA|nr:hypothetical protein FNV43_RR23416 [Rhamnella rubrinervis]
MHMKMIEILRIERVRFLTLTFYAGSGLLLLMLVPKSEGQIFPPPLPPRPLCSSQFALASYACSQIPFSPLPPPQPPSPPSPPDNGGHRLEHEHSHRHGHGHGHGHRHRHHDSPAEESCCRWVKQLDSQCVCDLLVRLPNFLSRPAHEYSVIVGDACNVSFPCGGRAIRI